jgi:hypothetical protein
MDDSAIRRSRKALPFLETAAGRLAKAGAEVPA